MEAQLVVKTIRSWLEQMVVGLRLCPFAAAPLAAGQVRFKVAGGDKQEDLLRLVLEEAFLLQETESEEIETTLVIFPEAVTDFFDFLELVQKAETLLEEAELEGIIQLATFHPAYQFEGAEVDEVQNYTNRSPYPIIHLLREESISRVLEHYPDPEGIPQRNIEMMERLGLAKIQLLLQSL